ncbi:MAG: DUF4422 domain-containing protein [Lachnospiraceae bacterium]|nr:DUF4422 domain-containing protein [Lachnospiraceae bacterium]
MDTRIYVMTHKEYTKPKDDLYVSLHVGKALGNDFGYLGDDTGENISEQNASYCELTGMYWLWKNVTCDNIGICHYRRYFIVKNDFITKEYIEETLLNYDIIVPNSECTKYKNVAEHYEKLHNKKDMLLCRDIIAEKYPDYIGAFDLCMNCNFFSLGNMVVTKKSIFNKYCEWLFDILFEVERRIDVTGYDTFQARVMGYLSERLFRVWLLNNSYKIKEEKVELADPKDCANGVKEAALKYQYIKLTINDLITVYNNHNYVDIVDIPMIKKDFCGKNPIWICCPAGEENVSERVRGCINSIRGNIPKDKAEVHIITFQNLHEYITLPLWIIKNYEAGSITAEHLTDIIEAQLLYLYGGLWIEPVYFVLKAFPESFDENRIFYTLKMENVLDKFGISRGRWTKSFMYSRKGSVLFRFLLNAIYMYWCSRESMIDRQMFDYIMSVAWDNIEEIKNIADDGGSSGKAFFEAENILNKKFNNEVMEKIKAEAFVLKIPEEMEFRKENVTGEKTFYGEIFEIP